MGKGHCGREAIGSGFEGSWVRAQWGRDADLERVVGPWEGRTGWEAVGRRLTGAPARTRRMKTQGSVGTDWTGLV